MSEILKIYFVKNFITVYETYFKMLKKIRHDNVTSKSKLVTNAQKTSHGGQLIK